MRLDASNDHLFWCQYASRFHRVGAGQRCLGWYERAIGRICSARSIHFYSGQLGRQRIVARKRRSAFDQQLSAAQRKNNIRLFLYDFELPVFDFILFAASQSAYGHPALLDV